MPILTDLLLESGIPQDAVIWLFILPIAVIFAVALRQIIGIKGTGIAFPLLIGFAVSALGVQVSVLIFSVMLSVMFIMRLILKRVRLLYLPKIGLVIISAILGLAAVLPFLPYEEGLNTFLAGFSLVVIVLSLEQFVVLLTERGPRRTFAVLVETALVALPVSFLVNWKDLHDLILKYPVFISLGLLAINFLLGKWTGLRISEIVRFKNIIFK